jgi:hypothetical protein
MLYQEMGLVRHPQQCICCMIFKQGHAAWQQGMQYGSNAYAA